MDFYMYFIVKAFPVIIMRVTALTVKVTSLSDNLRSMVFEKCLKFYACIDDYSLGCTGSTDSRIPEYRIRHSRPDSDFRGYPVHP
jgi:hypothetical protein